MESKVCTLCKVEKPLEEFRNHKLGKFGKHSRCHECERIRKAQYRASPEGHAKDLEYARQYRLEHREESLAANRAYHKEHRDQVANRKKRNRRENPEVYQAYVARPEVQERMRAAEKRSRERYPEKVKARSAVSNALQSGKLVKQPCEVCGAEDVHAHHDDYSKPLEVRWLCSEHHGEAHRLSSTTSWPCCACPWQSGTCKSPVPEA